MRFDPPEGKPEDHEFGNMIDAPATPAKPHEGK
jgi:hypothetical protein